MTTIGSTLEDVCDEYVGRTLIVEPHYGWGWVHQEPHPLQIKAASQPSVSPNLPIVGIGASAGGLEAIELFLKQVPKGSVNGGFLRHQGTGRIPKMHTVEQGAGL